MAYSGKLVRSGNNAKTIKGDDEFETAIMYLAPYNLAGRNVCPMAEKAGCIAGCLNTAGRGAFSNVQLARINKTKRYLADRAKFMNDLAIDIGKFVRKCGREGRLPAVRLNGTSDIQFEVAHPCEFEGKRYESIFAAFPQVQFYDYTKIYKRVYKTLPENYTLVLSYSEANPAYAAAITKAAIDTGSNVAIVYRDKALRDHYITSGYGFGYDVITVIDGDETDMRFLDPQGVIVGLYAKGKAKKDKSGFVIG